MNKPTLNRRHATVSDASHARSIRSNMRMFTKPLGFFIVQLLLVDFNEAAVPKAPIQGTRLYDVVLTEAALENANPKILGPGSWLRVVHKIRGSPPTLNAFYTYIRELPYSTNISWIPYQKRDGKWTETMGAGHTLLCTILESNIEMYRSIFNASNFPRKCPVPPGNYTINDFQFDTKYMPPYLPGNEWNIRMGWWIGRELIGNFRIGFKIDRTREVRSKRKSPKH